MIKDIKDLTSRLISKSNTSQLTLLMDTVVLANKYHLTMGKLDKLEEWNNRELKLYSSKHGIEYVNNNINTIREAQSLKKIKLPYQKNILSTREEHDEYRRMRKSFEGVL